MDIVQYLHGLVSGSMGISDESTNADLLKQYYALSIARLIEIDLNIDDIDIEFYNSDDLWGTHALPLVERMARSFHIDEIEAMTLITGITPLMMTELANLAKNVELIPFLTQNFGHSLTHLPVWSSRFIGNALIQKVKQFTPNQPNHDTPDDSESNSPIVSTTKTATDETPKLSTISNDDNTLKHTNQNDTPSLNRINKPKPKNTPSPLVLGLGVGVMALLVGGGAWYFLQKNNDPISSNNDPALATPNIENLTPPRLSLTSGENGTLYACQAEVGNSELQTRLLEILQKNFGQVGCIMDIDGSFGTSLTGLERLESIIAMVKSEPFTSIEVIGNHIYVNTPKTEILPRLVGDIALLAPQFKVSPMPALDKNTLINQSIERATIALNKLGNPVNDYELSRASSLVMIDFNGSSEVPTNVHGVLSLIADKLAQNPNIKFIIATHTSSGNTANRMADLTLSTTQAEALKTFLVNKGVNESQLIPKGVGDNFPIADNVTGLGIFKNNRSEFLVFNEATMSSLNVDMTQIISPAPNMEYTPTSQNAPIPLNEMPTQNIPISATPTYQEVQNYPPQGMPNGNYIPQSVEYAIPTPETNSYVYIGSTPPPSTSTSELPDDFIELSNSAISSERGKNNELEIR